MPCPGLLHPEPLPLQESTADPDLRKRHSHTALSQSLWGLWVLVPLFERSEHLWREWGLILNTNSPLLPSCWGFSFALGHGVSPQSRSSTAPNSKLITLFQVYCFNWNFCDPCCLTNTTFCRSSTRSIPEKLEPAPKCHGNSN